MKRALFCLLVLCAITLQAQQPIATAFETGSFTAIEAGGGRFIRVRIFFAQPFKWMHDPGCFAEIVKPSPQAPNGHGVGEVQEHSLMWVQIYAEVGERVDWTCWGER